MARQDNFLSAAAGLSAYSGWSPDEIRTNVTDVLSSGDTQRIGGLTQALSALKPYGGWGSEEIESNLRTLFPQTEIPQPTFRDTTPQIEPAIASSTAVDIQPTIPQPTEEQVAESIMIPAAHAGARGAAEAVAAEPPPTEEMGPEDIPLPELEKPMQGPGGEVPGTPQTYDMYLASLPKEDREKIENDARYEAYWHEFGKIGSVSAGLAASIPFLNQISDEEKAEFLSMNPELFMAGQLGGTVLQSIGLAGLVGKGLQAIPAIAKSPLLVQAITRATVAGGLSGARGVDEAIRGKGTLAEAVGDAVRGAGAGLVSIVPEVFAPANAIQLIAQPLADLVYDVGVGAVSGEDVGSDDWWKNELLNLAISEGFAIRDVASGAKFKATQGAQRAEVQKWLKGKGGDGFEILDKLDLPRPTPGDEQRPTETKIGEPTKSVAETKPEEEEPTFDVGTAGADATNPTKVQVPADLQERVVFGKVEVSPAQKDKLTGLPNNSVTKTQVDAVADDDWTISIDGDKFKAVNDTQGHKAGDNVITQIGALFHKHFGQFDDVFYGREGGEEFFGNLGKELTPEKLAAAQAFLEEAPDAIRIGNDPFTLSMGIGKGNYTTEGGDKALVSDRASFMAKDSGRNQLVVDKDGVAEYIKGKEVGRKQYVVDFSRKQAKEAIDELAKAGEIDAATAKRLRGEVDRGQEGPKTGGQRVSETAPGEPVKPPKTPTAAKKPPAGDGNQKERSFPKTAEKKGRVGGTDKLYTPQSNAESIKRADALIEERGLVGAEEWVKSDESKGADKTVVALRLIDHYQTSAGKVEGAKSEANMQKAMDIASETARALTSAGQEIQAVRVLSKIAPETFLTSAQKQIDRVNRQRPKARQLILKTEDARKITRLAKEAQTWDTLDKETQNTVKAIQKVLDTGEVTVADINSLKTLQARIRDAVGVEPRSPKPRATPKKPSLNSMLQSRLSDMAAERMAKYKKAEQEIRLRAGLPAEEMADMSIIGAAKLAETGLRFVEWSKSMVSDLGEDIKPHLKKIYRRAQSALKTERARTRKLWEQATAIDRILKRLEANEMVPEDMLVDFQTRLAEAEQLTGEARTEAVLETQQAIEMLKPVGLLRKVSTIQTLAQLLNVKTLGRNIIGNALMQGAERVSSVVGTPIDIVVSKATGKRSVTLRRGGVKALEEMYKGLMFATRRAWKGLPQGDIETKYSLKAPAFRTDAEGKFKYAERAVAYMERALGVVLGATDRAVVESAKNRTLGELAELAAINNRIPKAERTEYVQNWIKNASDEAIDLSHEYGKYVTFQDDNFLADAATKLKRDILNVKKDFGIGDLILKYPKTPSNLVNRAFAYSPAGFVKSMYHLAKAIPAFGGEFDQRAFVQSMSRALVGTAGLTGMGYALYNLGVITGDAENYSVSAFEREQTGGGPFRINTSALMRWAQSGFKGTDVLKKRQGDTMVSYDWAQPLAISLSMGANWQQTIQDEYIKKGDYGSLLGNMVDLFSAGAQSFAELPMLTGLQTLFGRGVPGDEGRQAIRAFERVFEQAPSSFVPTFVYQIRQVMDNTAREKHDPNPFRKALNGAINKLPFVEKMLPEAYNTLGLKKKEIYKGGTNSLFNVFFNPAFVTKYEVDPMVQMILEPYVAERRTGQLPRRAPRKITYSVDRFKGIAKLDELTQDKLAEIGASRTKDNVVMNLDAKDISELQRFMAALTTKQLQNVNRGALKKKTPEQQEKILAKSIQHVSQMARLQYLQKKAGIIKRYTLPKEAQ